MNEAARALSEIFFNILYLSIIVILVIKMLLRLPRVTEANRKAAIYILWAYLLLSIVGDVPHLAFRITGYVKGSMNILWPVGQWQINPVGLAAMLTGATFTLFYVCMLLVWRVRYGQSYGPLGYLLFAAAALRLLIMLFPQNDWNSPFPQQPWFAIRTLPMVFQQIGTAFLFLRDAGKQKDRPFVWVGWMMAVSCLLLLPMTFYIQRSPMLGMLMAPKTMTYIVMAFLAFSAIYGRKALAKNIQQNE